ncbi:hypothetical protein MKX01_013220 [Papaver californicum]|nr:hypothetical protein MKX01_013220 [Papaver californicum]
MVSPLLRSSSSTSSLPSASSSSSIRVSSTTTREGTAKATVNDHISQAAHLLKLPKTLLAKTATIKNTAQVLEQMPRVISSLDAHMESGLQSVPHLKTVTQLLSTMESTQLQHSFRAHQPQVVAEEADKLPEPQNLVGFEKRSTLITLT